MWCHCHLPILLLASHKFPWYGRGWLFCLPPNPIPKPGSFTPWSIMTHSALTLWSLPPTPFFTCLPAPAGPYFRYSWNTTFRNPEAFSTISTPSPDNITPSCTPEFGTSIHSCVHQEGLTSLLLTFGHGLPFWVQGKWNKSESSPQSSSQSI